MLQMKENWDKKPIMVYNTHPYLIKTLQEEIVYNYINLLMVL